MCEECGCGLPSKPSAEETKEKKEVKVLKKILQSNDVQAESNRKHFEKYGVLAINLMSSPGAGKTSLLEKTILALKDKYRIGVIEGDLETERDAERVRKQGAIAYQITTGQTCHLDAFMVHKGIHHLPLKELDLVFIENVGNLVCPASYDVGAHYNIVFLSVPEGDDKVAKYPVMFRKADLILFTKVDLLPYFDYDIEKEKETARKLKPNVDILEVSTKDIESIKKVASWIKFKMEMRWCAFRFQVK